MKLIVHLLVYLSVIACVLCSSYFFGEKTSGTKLINREKIIDYAFPWFKRTATYKYNDTSQRPIKAIDCYDYQRTEATVDVAAGGVGSSFVEMLFTSQTSYGLEFAVEIFA